jgi:hypothetical protein
MNDKTNMSQSLVQLRVGFFIIKKLRRMYVKIKILFTFTSIKIKGENYGNNK